MRLLFMILSVVMFSKLTNAEEKKVLPNLIEVAGTMLETEQSAESDKKENDKIEVLKNRVDNLRLRKNFTGQFAKSVALERKFVDLLKETAEGFSDSLDKQLPLFTIDRLTWQRMSAVALATVTIVGFKSRYTEKAFNAGFAGATDLLKNLSARDFYAVYQNVNAERISILGFMTIAMNYYPGTSLGGEKKQLSQLNTDILSSMRSEIGQMIDDHKYQMSSEERSFLRKLYYSLVFEEADSYRMNSSTLQDAINALGVSTGIAKLYAADKSYVRLVTFVRDAMAIVISMENIFGIFTDGDKEILREKVADLQKSISILDAQVSKAEVLLNVISK